MSRGDNITETIIRLGLPNFFQINGENMTLKKRKR